ncbi:MAG: SCO family protein [Geobacter sp.]|nr:SCO family protein [Geobacter sp.]
MRRAPTLMRQFPALAASLLALLVMAAIPAFPHTAEDEVLAGVGVDEKLGAQVPLNLTFRDQSGRSVRLGDLVSNGPVILTLNYYSCPTLCPVFLRALSKTVDGIKGLSLASDYRIVTVSIDPDDTVGLARSKATETYGMLPGVTGLPERWPFLVGKQEAISRLTQAVGFRYVRTKEGEFAHPSLLVILTPNGRVSRYLYGVEQRPQDLKLALIEAAGGKIGGATIMNRVILYCYHYDPAERRYALVATNVMKIVGGAVLGLLGLLLFVLWKREKT